jgi:hypothetical protein
MRFKWDEQWRGVEIRKFFNLMFRLFCLLWRDGDTFEKESAQFLACRQLAFVIALKQMFRTEWP